MKILVAGGAGYVGSPLCRILWEAGHEVTVLDSLCFGGESLLPLLPQPRFRLVAGDIRDERLLAEVMPGHDTVCLLAAIVGEPACNRDRELAVDVNRHGSSRVLAAARAAGVGRFLFFSTCSNYGATDPAQLVTEEAPLQPISTYAETKVAAEEEVLAAHSADFCPTVLRLSTAFGVSPRMRFDLLVSDFTLAAMREGKLVIYGEQFWRPFVHVADVAETVQTVLAADQSVVGGEVFNVGRDDNNVQKMTLAQIVAEHVPGTTIETVQRDTDPRSYRVSFAKLREKLGGELKWTVPRGVEEVHRALQAGIWRDPTEPRFHN